MVKILGIDPGLNVTGWGIIKAINKNDMKFIGAGFIKTDNKSDLAQRLKYIYTELSQIIKLYQPDEAAIEEIFVNNNALSSLKLGHARAASMLTISLEGIKISEYAATLVKKTLVGNGRAEKTQVEAMIRIFLPEAKITIADMSDSLAVAICHMRHRGNKL